MKDVSIGQDRRPVSRRGVLGLGFAGTLGLPAVGRAIQDPQELSPPQEERVVECVVWAMCVKKEIFDAVLGGDFTRIEAHHRLSKEAKALLTRICKDGADAITTLRAVLECEPALTARTALGKIFEKPARKPPCPKFPCPWL